MVEQTVLPASCVEAKRFCEEAGMNICVPRAKQLQVCMPPLTLHSSNDQNKEGLEETMQDTLKQRELITQESDLGETV